MNRGLLGFLAGVAVGGAVVHYAADRNESSQPDSSPPPRASSTSSTDTRSPRLEGERARADDRSGTERMENAASTTRAGTSSPAGDPALQPDLMLALPGGKLDAQRSGDAAPLDKLLNSMSAWCEFDAGAGANWPHGKVLAHDAAWQGGALEFEAINLVDQTALMTRNPWRSASAEGTPLRVTATNTGMHFSGFKPDGELIALTVYGVLDSNAHYRAVISLHGTHLDHESAQFYGWCSVR